MNITIRYYLHWTLNLARAALNLPRFLKALAFAKPVPLEKARERLALCHGCPDLDMITDQCRHCWCFVQKKVQWCDERCPIGRWGAMKVERKPR